MSTLTVESLAKQTEYKEIIDHFKKWRRWQRHYFFCQYTSSLEVKILEMLLTDFEPLYHSGYNRLASQEEESETPSTDSLLNNRPESIISCRNRQCRIPEERLQHVHVTEEIFDTKTMADFILKPNPINMEVFGQTMNTNQMKEHFLEELEKLAEIYSVWEAHEYIYLIHVLFPYCDKATLLYLSSCVNLRVYAHNKFLRLPDRAVEVILSYLAPHDLVNVALVCKSWQHMSYKSCSWKIHALELNESYLDFGSIVNRSDDTMWRRIYIELYEISRQRDCKPRLRFGSIIQTFPTAPNQLMASERKQRLSLVPEMIQAAFKNAVSNNTTITETELSKLDLERADLRSSVSSTPRKIKASLKHSPGSSINGSVTPSTEAGNSPLKIGSARIHSVNHTSETIPLETDYNEEIIDVPRIASIHGSCCQEDELAYEEVTHKPKRHSERHVNFVKDITGYSNWMSALATTYPLKEVSELVGHKQPVYTFQADSLRIISGCKNGVIRIWDSKTGRPVKKITAHSGAINSLQFDGHKIVTGGWDNFVKIFSVSSLQCLSVLKGHTDSVTRSFFNKHHLISVSLDKTIRVYLPKTTDDSSKTVCYTCEHVLTGHEAGITHGDMDDRSILTGSLDTTIRIWCSKFYSATRVIHCGGEILHFTIDQGLILASTSHQRLVFIDRKKEVPSHTISTGSHNVNFIWLYGSRFITGDTAGEVKEWDLPSGALLRILYGHLGEIYCIQANRTQIMTSSFDHSIKIWHLADLKATENALE